MASKSAFAIGKLLRHFFKANGTLALLVSVVISTVAIQQQFFHPWSSLTVVAIYGLGLWGAVAWGGLKPPPALRDSPYFLGFLLTLVCLFVLFQIRLNGELPTSKLSTTMLRDVGAALGTSIVGLFFRHAVVSADRVTQEREEHFAELEDELRTNIADFRRSQVELVAALKEFARDRTKMLREERKISSEYVASLRTAHHQLGQIMKSAAKQAGQVGSEVGELLDRTRKDLESIHEKLVLYMNTYDAVRPAEKLQHLAEASRKAGRNFEAVARSASQSGKSLKQLHSRTESLTAEIGEIDRLLEDFIRVTRRRVDQIDRVARG